MGLVKFISVIADRLLAGTVYSFGSDCLAYQAASDREIICLADSAKHKGKRELELSSELWRIELEAAHRHEARVTSRKVSFSPDG